MTKGNLYLIPTPLCQEDAYTFFSEKQLHILYHIDTFIVEELRTARRFLRKAGFTSDFDTIVFYLLNEHTPIIDTQNMIQQALKGKNIGLMSEAGLPCIADPGNVVVRLAHQLDIKVIPWIGPSSITLALMASGLNGQNFSFQGYLPVKQPYRAKALQQLSQKVIKTGETQIFIETPYRNNAMLQSIVECCSPSLSLCVAADITSGNEYIKTYSVQEWKNKKIELNKRPTVFLIGK